MNEELEDFYIFVEDATEFEKALETDEWWHGEIRVGDELMIIKEIEGNRLKVRRLVE